MYDFKGNGFSENEEKQFGVYVNDLTNSGLTKEQMGLAFGAMKHAQDTRKRDTVDLDAVTGISVEDARAAYVNFVNEEDFTKETRQAKIKELVEQSSDEAETKKMFKQFGIKL